MLFTPWLPLLIAGCGSDKAPSSPDSSMVTEDKTTGHFSCNPHAPERLLFFSSSADVAPGHSATITVQAPPGAKINPELVDVHCQVDQKWCSGSTCGGDPPVEFITPQGDGQTWENVRSSNGDSKMSFTAIAHNLGKLDSHHVTLTIGIPKAAVQFGGAQ
ncbi:hypothetical protein [Novosphingobium terrae]|jgi:hypothetical protein|uniref:hypothetical protein n=1 Tax=Novosphingobium terrae TaxID=2726189 RepID=UPI0019800CB6|nr:hypothetical protein [Novosphingobium terrae]